MNAKEYINTEYYNNTKYRLRKEFDGSITLNSIYSPYSQWSNCTDEEFNLRLTPKRLYINMSYFSDLSGRQKTDCNRIYINRNEDIDKIFNKAVNLKDMDDDIELHAELKEIFKFFDDLYNRSTPLFC